MEERLGQLSWGLSELQRKAVEWSFAVRRLEVEIRTAVK